MKNDTKIVLLFCLFASIIVSAGLYYLSVRMRVGDLPIVLSNSSDQEIVYQLVYNESSGVMVDKFTSAYPHSTNFSRKGICVIVKDDKVFELTDQTYVTQSYTVDGRQWNFQIPVYDLSVLEKPCLEDSNTFIYNYRTQ